MERFNTCLCQQSQQYNYSYSEVKLCGMWVEMYKNIMSHLILQIVAIRLAAYNLLSQQKAKRKKWQTAICPQK